MGCGPGQAAPAVAGYAGGWVATTKQSLDCLRRVLLSSVSIIMWPMNKLLLVTIVNKLVCIGKVMVVICRLLSGWARARWLTDKWADRIKIKDPIKTR